MLHWLYLKMRRVSPRSCLRGLAFDDGGRVPESMSCPYYGGDARP